MAMIRVLLLMLALSSTATNAQVTDGNTWQNFIAGPQSSNVHPVKILSTYGNVTNPSGLLPGGQGPAVLTRLSEESESPTVVIDFGLNTVGFLQIQFGQSSNNTPGIRLAFSETQQYLTNVSDFTRSDNMGNPTTDGTDQIAVSSMPFLWIDTFGCKNGTQVCSDGLHGFRYLKIYLDAIEVDAPITQANGTVEIESVSLNFTGFVGTPDSYRGWFESSDNQLTQFWYDAAYTNEMITDTFRPNDTDPRNAASPTLDGKLVLFDGAKRDRDPYVGDIAVSGRTDYLTHVTGAAKNVLADLANHQRADGWIPPASINDYTLALFDYSLWWVSASWDYILYTGDVQYGRDYYSNLVAVLDNWFPSTTSSTSQLLVKPAGYGDYAFLARSGEVTYYNALYVLALQNAGQIATMLGNTSDAIRWQTRAGVVADAINMNLWDGNVGAYLDVNDGSGRHPQDGNSLAVIAQVANTSRGSSAMEYLANNTQLPYGNAFMDNDSLGAGFSERVYAFLSYFEIQARFLVGMVDSAFDEIRRLYGWMASQDPGITFWEGIGSNGSKYEGAYTSAAHGWSTGVVPALTNFLLGVTPTEPGFARFQIKPYPGNVSWAQGQVPTMYGPIEVRWEASNLSMSLNMSFPNGTICDLLLPVRGNAMASLDGKELSGTTVTNGYVVIANVSAGLHSAEIK